MQTVPSLNITYTEEKGARPALLCGMTPALNDRHALPCCLPVCTMMPVRASCKQDAEPRAHTPSCVLIGRRTAQCRLEPVSLITHSYVQPLVVTPTAQAT